MAFAFPAPELAALVQLRRQYSAVKKGKHIGIPLSASGWQSQTKLVTVRCQIVAYLFDSYLDTM